MQRTFCKRCLLEFTPQMVIVEINLQYLWVDLAKDFVLDYFRNK